MARNPLEIIRGYLDFFTERLQQAIAANEAKEYIGEVRTKIGLLQTLEADMEIEYFPLGDKTTLGDLRKGAVSATEDGVYAVKSEYHYDIIDGIAYPANVSELATLTHEAKIEYMARSLRQSKYVLIDTVLVYHRINF